MAPSSSEIDTSIIPGTTHLVDMHGNMHTTHDANNKEIVLIPTPSDDPEDPLNWPKGRKQLHMFCIAIYCLFVGIASAAIYSVLVPITEVTGLTLSDLNAGTGYMFLFFGLGCLVFQPLALQYGKRPVYLFSMLATLAVQVWAPYTTSNGQWIASKILQGFFGSPIESLCEISVADIYFAHERGYYIGIYGVFLLGSNIVAPVLAGFILDGQGWRWVLYWPAIGCGLGFIILFFFMEETNYDRKTVGIVETIGTPTVSISGEEKGAHTASVSPASPPTGEVYRRMTYLDKLKLFGTSKPFQLWTLMKRPFVFLSFPVVVYCGFAYGCTVIWFNIMNGLSSLILSSPPYNFKASIVGLFFLSFLIGAVIGCMSSGVMGDWLIIRLARRNNGIMESEHRLWLFVIPIICLPSAFILFGVGSTHEVHWFGLAFAGFLFSGSIGVTLNLCVNYCIDTYADLGGEAMITVIVIRNTMSFGIGYGVTPWANNLGIQNTFISAAFISMAASLAFLIMVRWGKNFRENSRLRYWRYVGEGKALGLAH